MVPFLLGPPKHFHGQRVVHGPQVGECCPSLQLPILRRKHYEILKTTLRILKYLGLGFIIPKSVLFIPSP